MAKKKMAARKTATKKATTRKPATTKAAAKRKTGGRAKAAKRTLVNTGIDKRYVRRSGAGRFKESDDVGRALTRDRRTKAKTKAKRGQGDKGDR